MINYISLQTKLDIQEVKNTRQQGFISGYASVFGHLDDQGDRVIQGAFSASLKNIQKNNKWPKMLWQHDPKEPIGQWTKIQQDDQGLYVEGKLLLELQKGREAYALLKEGVIDGLSIGYRVIEAHKSQFAEERLLSQLDLLEVSLVTFAANSKAKVLEIKDTSPTPSYFTQRINQLTDKIHHALNRK